MSEVSDAELLSKWLKHQSEEAFRALTARYAGLVFMAARQTCRNEALAADAAQLTFITLARKGASLSGRATLAGWLHRTAVFHSRNALQSQRSESRKRDEFETHFRSMTPDPSGETWEEIEPLLAEALDALPGKDRDALLLRYYRRLSLKEIAEVQTISAAAAQKRVDRAIERLRRQFTLRGCVAGSGLGAALAHGLGGIPSVPSATVASLTKQSIAAAASAAMPSLLSLLLSLFAMKKALVILSAILLLAVVGTLALRAKPATPPSTPVNIASQPASDARSRLRPVGVDAQAANPAAAEQERLKKLYGEEQWRVSTRTAEDVVACVQAIRSMVDPQLSKLKPDESLGSMALMKITGPDALPPDKLAEVQQLSLDYTKRRWEESRQALDRFNRAPAPLLELLLASDACASGKMSLEDYEKLRNGNPDFEAVAIPVDLVNRNINADFGQPLKDPAFVEALGSHLNELGRTRLDEIARERASAKPVSTSTFDLLPPTRLENLAAQAKGARQIIESLVESGEMK
ncbi:RNA polymerase sigma factor [Luteolibacter soli]|uniref:Sigma-70 family RNA polymerase sigma factor n=1 Tax=Luteolibacter soli TaxID=3135280 RepID=A0ABU9AQ33_9BACT